METVVVGLEASQSSGDHICWAAEYCRVTGAELVGAVAYRPSQSELPPEWYEEELARTRKQAEAALDALTPPVPYRVEVHHGDPRRVVADITDQERAAMTVVGVHGTGGLRGLGVGSVAHDLAHHLLVPVVTVPALGGPLRGSPVVVGLDGSPGESVTLDWALRLADAVGGSVCAVYASDPMAMSYPHPRGATIADQKEEVVRDLVATVAGSGVDIEVVVEVAEPVAVLTRVADQRHASTVVVGRKGAGHLRGVLLGRVPARLPFHAHRPVAIVPRQASD